jgi:hypothetical protein|tara:strand:- start:2786 stop:3025 length:240 start_codon:yes stop_codon:yes gene_type:complete
MAYDMAIGMIFGLASGGIAGWIAHKTVQAIKDDQTPSVDVYTDSAGNIKDVSCSDHVHLRYRMDREMVDRWRDNRVIKP